MWLTAGVAGLCCAQETDWLRPRTLEIGIMGGNTIGDAVQARIELPIFRGFRVGGAGQYAVSLHVGKFVTPRLLFFGQATGVNAKREYHLLGSGYSAETNMANGIYEAGFAGLFPLKATPRIVPYLLGSGATVQTRADLLVNFTNPNPDPPATEVLGGATRVRQNKAVFAISAGGGVRFYINRWFGLRMEARGYFPVTGVKAPSGLGLFGAFFQLR